MAQAPAAAAAAPAVIGPVKVAWLNWNRRSSAPTMERELAKAKVRGQEERRTGSPEEGTGYPEVQMSIQGAKLTDEARADLKNRRGKGHGPAALPAGHSENR
jgi:hypothetical protein